MNRVRVKFCGITRVEDATRAVSLGADAIGVIFHSDSPRNVSLEQAKGIRLCVPALVSLTGVFVTQSTDEISEITEQVGLDLIQLHGRYTNQQARALPRPFIKTIRCKSAEQVQHEEQAYPDARALLLDPYVKGKPGGTGEQLPSHLWPNQANKALILAGGLGPENLAESIRELSPYAVDINSGVESQPGVKDAELMARAMRAVKGC